MNRDERVEAAVQEGLTSYDWYMFNADSGLEYAVEEAIATALTASDALLRTGIERALFKIEGIHHIHGTQCLCGFESHRSRSRTEHITDEIRKAFTALLGEEE